MIPKNMAKSGILQGQVLQNFEKYELYEAYYKEKS